MSRTLDVFFGFSQIAVDGVIPSEATMWDNLLRQVRLADTLGFGTAWVGGAHLSLAEQQRSAAVPALPHFRGEVCLNTDILQLAPVLFSATTRIAVGSAIHGILGNGGPIAHAEALRTFLALQARTPWAGRTLRYGFGAGRFDFVHQAYGLAPRTPVERAHWGLVRKVLLREAVDVLVRLLDGQALASTDLGRRGITRADCPSDAAWEALRSAAGTREALVEVAPFFPFERLRLIPTEAPRDTLRLYLGSTDQEALRLANAVLPCRVFNLSNTPDRVLDATHALMASLHHPQGGPWRRGHMPRTVLVFVDADRRRSPAAQREHATARAARATEAWQRAMEGTVDPVKLREGMENAVFGNPDDVAQAIHRRFHRDDTLMLWFDFNDHDSGRVEGMMADFHEHVVPRLRALEAAEDDAGH